MIGISTSGNTNRVEQALKKFMGQDIFSQLNRFGQEGVNALSAATPKDSGETSISWYYEIVHTKGRYSLEFKNRNVIDGVNIAIIIQYGHGTRNGGYVVGRDYINPVILPLFERIKAEVWKAVRSA